MSVAPGSFALSTIRAEKSATFRDRADGGVATADDRKPVIK